MSQFPLQQLEQTLNNLEALAAQFQDNVPPDVVAQIEQIRTLIAERRQRSVNNLRQFRETNW